MELQQTSDPPPPNPKYKWGSGFWASTLNPHWCQEQDRQFSQEQELGPTTESTLSHGSFWPKPDRVLNSVFLVDIFILVDSFSA